MSEPQFDFSVSNEVSRVLQGMRTGTYDSTEVASSLSQNAADEDHRPMSMTREELEAHLKAQSAQTEANLARHSGAMAAAIAQQNGAMEAAIARQNGAIDARLGAFGERINQAIKAMDDGRVALDKKIDDLRLEVRTENKTTRTTVLITAISSVLAIVLGVAAFNATVLSNMTASFESGKNTADAIAKAADQLRQAQELAAKVQAQQQPKQ